MSKSKNSEKILFKKYLSNLETKFDKYEASDKKFALSALDVLIKNIQKDKFAPKASSLNLNDIEATLFTDIINNSRNLDQDKCVAAVEKVKSGLSIEITLPEDEIEISLPEDEIEISLPEDEIKITFDKDEPVEDIPIEITLPVDWKDAKKIVKENTLTNMKLQNIVLKKEKD